MAGASAPTSAPRQPCGPIASVRHAALNGYSGVTWQGSWSRGCSMGVMPGSVAAPINESFAPTYLQLTATELARRVGGVAECAVTPEGSFRVKPQLPAPPLQPPLARAVSGRDRQRVLSPTTTAL